MSRAALIEATCDRCGDQAMIAGDDVGRKLALWGRVFAARCDYQEVVGTTAAPSDLCAGCLFELVEFMGGAKLAAGERAEAAE